jgi:sn-glycerol 3-phosphate transport system substrate-binding protein
MSFSTRLLTIAAAGAVTIVISTTGAFAVEKTKFDFWFGNTGDIAKVVQQVCDNFNKSQNDYEIVCTTQGSYDAALQNTIAAYRANKQPTIVQVFDIGTLTMLLSDAFQPVNKLMADNGYKIDWSNYFGGISAYYATSKGDMYSMPFNSSTALLYWNQDAFKKIGKDAAPKTWEEVADDMKALKTAGYDCPMGIDISNNEVWQLMEQFSAIHNIPVATENDGYDGLDAELVFNKGKFVQMVTDLKSWYDEGLVKLKSKQAGEDYVTAFASAHCQMTLTSVGDHGTISRTAAPTMNWSVAELPVYAGTERKNSLVGGASLWVLKGHSDAEYKGASAFLNFIAQPEQALFWSSNTGYIPVTKSGYDFMVQNGFYGKAPYKGRELAIASLTASEPTPITRGMRLGAMPQIRQEVGNALQAIFANQVSVQQGLDDAAARGNSALRKFEATYKGKTLP